MLLDNNFKYLHDPFGIVDFSTSNIIPIIVPTPKHSKSSWFWWFLIIVILLIIVFLGRPIYHFFFKKKEDEVGKEKCSNMKTLASKIKLPSQQKIIGQYDLGNEVNWNLELIELKKAEGKAVFIAQKGWILYE